MTVVEFCRSRSGSSMLLVCHCVPVTLTECCGSGQKRTIEHAKEEPRCVPIVVAHLFSEEHIDTGFEDKQPNETTNKASVFAIELESRKSGQGTFLSYGMDQHETDDKHHRAGHAMNRECFRSWPTGKLGT